MSTDVTAALGRLRSMLAAEAVTHRFAVFAASYRQKYDPNQPRVPAGNSDGGQWTSGGGSTGGGVGRTGGGINDPRVLSDAPPDNDWKIGAQYAANRTRNPRGGHHWAPRGVFRKLPLSPETRSVFENDRTGPLAGSVHRWSKEHIAYNDAVREHLHGFLDNMKISSEQLTPDDARRFLTELKKSRDPRIREFNMRIYMREIMLYLRRGPRKPE